MEPSKFKHLNEENMEQTADGGWVPSIPKPFYAGSLLRRRSYQCGDCQRDFKSEADYKLHYRTAQLQEMNEAMAYQRELFSLKAKFWRRIAYVYRYGKPAEVTNLEHMFDGAGWGAKADVERMVTLNETLTGLWAPVHARTTGALPEDELELEDQTPDEAKGDFADPYTQVNSKGVTYYLNKKEITLRGGVKHVVWYFTADFRPQTAQRKLPDGYTVNENKRNGFLTVRKADGTVPTGDEGSEDQ